VHIILCYLCASVVLAILLAILLAGRDIDDLSSHFPRESLKRGSLLRGQVGQILFGCAEQPVNFDLI